MTSIKVGAKFTQIFNVSSAVSSGDMTLGEPRSQCRRGVEPTQSNGISSKDFCRRNYEGGSNEYLKSAIKIRNTARLSCKLTTMILMV